MKSSKTHEPDTPGGTGLLDSSNLPRQRRTAATALLRTRQRRPPRALLNVQYKIWEWDAKHKDAPGEVPKAPKIICLYRGTVGSDAVELASINDALFKAYACKRNKSQISFSMGPAYGVTDAFEDDDGRMHLVVCKDSGKDATLLRIPIELLLSKPGTSTFAESETQLSAEC